jgi:uncharacterized alkaline shock family protein YloU
LHGFLGFLFWVIVLLLGAWLVAGCLDFECGLISSLLADRSMRMVAGVVLVLLVIVYWISSIPGAKADRSVSYESEGGRVSVSVTAINSLLSRLADEFAGIVSLRASVSPKDKSVQLDMAVKSGAKLQELSQAIQQRVRESMQDSLGITDMGAIRVYVREIVLPESAPGKDRDAQGDWQNLPM